MSGGIRESCIRLAALSASLTISGSLERLLDEVLRDVKIGLPHTLEHLSQIQQTLRGRTFQYTNTPNNREPQALCGPAGPAVIDKQQIRTQFTGQGYRFPLATVPKAGRDQRLGRSTNLQPGGTRCQPITNCFEAVGLDNSSATAVGMMMRPNKTCNTCSAWIQTKR